MAYRKFSLLYVTNMAELGQRERILVDFYNFGYYLFLSCGLGLTLETRAPSSAVSAGAVVTPFKIAIRLKTAVRQMTTSMTDNRITDG